MVIISAKKWRVVLYAGRFIPEKGPDLLVEALNHLSLPDGYTLRVLLAGEGPLRRACETRAAALPAFVRTDFLGNREDIPKLLKLSNLVALPSRWEGLPMVLLEAMAAEVPVIATRVGGIPEVITHKISGWLVPPENPHALSEGISHLLASPALSRQLSECAYQIYLQRFSPQVTMDRLIEVYSQVVV